MDVCKCVHCKCLDVNAKTTFCKLNNESNCTDNDIPCPLEVESDKEVDNERRGNSSEKVRQD